jgi:hypothetical protein
MYYEFRIIDGNPYFRTTPTGQWQQATFTQLLTELVQEQDENAKLLTRIYQLETYQGPRCPQCGSPNPIPLSTRCQCAQCMRLFTVK